MKSRTLKIAILILVVIKSSVLLSQTSTSQSEKISLSVVMPENLEDLTVKQLSQIETKIISIVTANGLGASGYSNNFVISRVISNTFLDKMNKILSVNNNRFESVILLKINLKHILKCSLL